MTPVGIEPVHLDFNQGMMDDEWVQSPRTSVAR